MRPILKGTDIVKSYDAISVLKGVSIDLEPEEIHAVIGPNGAGKTTLFKVLSGELRADAGKVELAGSDVSSLDAFERVRAGIGRTFQVARVFAELTALGNVVVAVEARRRKGRITVGMLRGIVPAARVKAEAAAILEEVGIDARSLVPAGVLAYGERKRLELGITLALEPRVLVLDEPMAGLSPADRASAVDLVGRIARERGVSVLLTEHDMGVVFALARRITVLNYGSVIASGTQAEIRSSPVVREVYLGHEAAHA